MSLLFLLDYRFNSVLFMREDLFFSFPLNLQTVLFRMKATTSEERDFPFLLASESQSYSSELQYFVNS